PAAVVIGDPAPFLVGDPVPAPFIRIDPVTLAIRPPVARRAVRNPHRAPAWMLDPTAVRIERFAEFDRHFPGLRGAQRNLREESAQAQQRNARSSNQARETAPEPRSEHAPLPRVRRSHHQMIPSKSSSAGAPRAGDGGSMMPGGV